MFKLAVLIVVMLFQGAVALAQPGTEKWNFVTGDWHLFLPGNRR